MYTHEEPNTTPHAQAPREDASHAREYELLARIDAARDEALRQSAPGRDRANRVAILEARLVDERAKLEELFTDARKDAAEFSGPEESYVDQRILDARKAAVDRTERGIAQLSAEHTPADDHVAELQTAIRDGERELTIIRAAAHPLERAAADRAAQAHAAAQRDTTAARRELAAETDALALLQASGLSDDATLAKIVTTKSAIERAQLRIEQRTRAQAKAHVASMQASRAIDQARLDAARGETERLHAIVTTQETARDQIVAQLAAIDRSLDFDRAVHHAAQRRVRELDVALATGRVTQ